MILILDITNEKDITMMYEIESKIGEEMRSSCWQLHRGGICFDRYLCGNGLMDIFDYGKLIFLDNMPIGYAYIFSDECEFELRVLPKYEKHFEEIISMLERQYQFGEDYIIVVNSRMEKLVKALKNVGYIRKEEERFQAMVCLNDLETPKVDWIEEQIEEYSEKFFSERVEYADLPTGQKVTEKMFTDYLNSSEHGNALDYVIQDCKTKKYAGFLTWWMDLSNNTALLEPVACLAEFRRRGIMKRSLEFGFWELKKRGIEYVYVSTSAKNQAAQALYLSVGFKKVGEANIYQREK